jgi:Coenzyme PQQ synthesis protein D (PqqD)
MLRRKSDSLLVREVEHELLLLDTAGDRVHQLNATASFIWSRCEQAQTPEELARWLVEAFDVDAEVALQDTMATLDTLRDLKLVREA